jgi:uncharacterized membrane protein
MPAEGNSAQQVNDVLTQLHDAGVINLDKSVREMLSPAASLAELQPGNAAASALIAWDGYGLVIKSTLGNVAELSNVAGQLRQATGGAG